MPIKYVSYTILHIPFNLSVELLTKNILALFLNLFMAHCITMQFNNMIHLVTRFHYDSTFEKEARMLKISLVNCSHSSWWSHFCFLFYKLTHSVAWLNLEMWYYNLTSCWFHACCACNQDLIITHMLCPQRFTLTL